MWDRIQDAARNATLFFEKTGENHKKCPRCKGSGLLVCSSKQQKNSAALNEPCWFCEGVGALPIAGLDGFVLARATPILQTNNQCVQPPASLRLELYLAKFPEMKCSFTTFKPNEDLTAQTESKIFQPTVPVRQTQVLNVSRPNPAIVWSRRSRSSSRQERNHIREKAKKAAVERRRQIMQTLSSYKDESSLDGQIGKPEGHQPFINSQSSEVPGSLHQPWINSEQFIPSVVTSRSVPLRSLALFGQSWINGLISRGVQTLTHIPNPGKSLNIGNGFGVSKKFRI